MIAILITLSLFIIFFYIAILVGKTSDKNKMFEVFGETKEMIYYKKQRCELLASGICFGYKYYVLNLGTHPTAYVEIPQDNKNYKKKYDDIDILVHGGLNYSEKSLSFENQTLEGWFIGWDYAHYGDYCGILTYLVKDNGKKWTTKEILADVFSVCEQLAIQEKGKQNELHK